MLSFRFRSSRRRCQSETATAEVLVGSKRVLTSLNRKDFARRVNFIQVGPFHYEKINFFVKYKVNT